jgi:molybdenum cofactor cytidylyltransferase
MIQLTAMVHTQKTPPPIAAVVLAAGASTRMGQSKQLLPIGDQPMVRRVTEVVCSAGLAQVIVVVGAGAGAVEKALDGLPVQVVFNEAWPGGLSTSVRTGLGALREEIQAALMILADQPALTPGLLRALVARYQDTGAPIVAPSHQGQRGNPVLFDWTLFPELAAAEGDLGGRALIARHREEVELVEVDDRALLRDIDTQADYEGIQNKGEYR